MDPENVIELWDIQWGWFLALIVFDEDSPYVWSNQCGGTCCAHPEARGVLVPLPGHWIPNPDPLLDDWCSATLSRDRTIRHAQAFLAQSDWLGRFKLEPDLVERFGEAWIPVTLLDDGGEPQLKPFVGKCGVLTYSNSD